MKVKINAILAYCTLCYFQYFLQLILQLGLTLFTTNIRIAIKKIFLNIMIIFIKLKIIDTCLKDTSCFARYKMREIKQINIKNRTYYFYNYIIDLKDFDAKLIKIYKKSYKNIYNIEYITTKKLMVLKIFIE